MKTKKIAILIVLKLSVDAKEETSVEVLDDGHVTGHHHEQEDTLDDGCHLDKDGDHE